MAACDHAGLLVLRVRRDANQTGRLRVRISQTLDISEPGDVTSMATTPDEICTAVREWLEMFLARNAPEESPGLRFS